MPRAAIVQFFVETTAYEEYRVMLSKESQVMLDDEYEKALAEDKLLVLAWDSATGRLVTTTFDLD